MRNLVIPTLLLLVSCFAQAQLPTTTTLSQQTANNTSAANTFTTQTDGNLGAGNISKLPIRTLLYPGATTKIFAHVEPWWGSGSHINIGYSSQDPAQVHRQVQDMVSRGIDGLVVDWYGPGSYEDTGVKLLISEAEVTPNFNVLVEIDVGAIKWHSCYPTCSATTAVINLFTAANTAFFSSSAILKNNGRPLLMEFGFETLTLPSGAAAGWNVVDWNAVQAQTPGNLALIHRNLGGYSKAQSTGAFVWMEPKSLTNYVAGFDDTADLNWFYSNSVKSYPTMPAYGAVWKGFDDTLAGWSADRHIDQNCGKTWLNTFASLNAYYSASNQLPFVQLVTWNDYEEGTEVETGIDNCLNLTASLSGTQLQWNPGGDESTLDHYTVYASADGQNLASLGDFTAGVYTLDLSTLSIPAGAYSLYVQAVGKPTIRNNMSAPVAYTAVQLPERPRPPVPKNITVAATPAAQTVTQGAAANYTLTVAEEGATDPVNLSCSGLPDGMACAFASPTLVPDVTGTSVQMTISTGTQTAQSDREAPVLALLGLGLLVGFPALSGSGRVGSARTRKKVAVAVFFAVLLLTQVACGGGSLVSTSASTTAVSPTPTITTPARTYAVTVTATSGDVTKSTLVSVTVN